MNILQRLLLLLLLLTTRLIAQVPVTNPEGPADTSRAAAAVMPASADTTEADSLQSDMAVARVDTNVFEMSQAAYAVASARMTDFIYQDLTQLLSNTLPGIPLAAGEVGEPHYFSSGELPARVIATFVDSVRWIPGVYGTVDLTSLPEAGAENVQFTGFALPGSAAGAAAASLQLASEPINYAEPLTHVGYTSGPFGADATCIGFSRAFSRRMTGALYGVFSNADGQFVNLPYKGHKVRLRFDYRLGRQWRLSYRHFNTRNEVGVGVPFFPEEWPELDGGFHKEERLYHALELAPMRSLLLRAFYWQVKEELNDPTRLLRHRLRDSGAEAQWHWERERAAISLFARSGSEQIHSDTIVPEARWYGDLAALFSWRLAPRFWMETEGQYQRKSNWPSGGGISLAGLWQPQQHTRLWLRARHQLVPPALVEKDSELLYLSSNSRLRAVGLWHYESGMAWQQQMWTLQAQLGSGNWQEGYVLTADSAAGPAYLRNAEQAENSLAARLQARWQPSPLFALHLEAAQNLRSLPQQYWFWYQPEGSARLHLELRRNFFKNDLEVLPRLSARYLGKRTSPVFSTASVLPQFKSFAGVATLDFNLRLRYGSGAMLFAWENLFNKKYFLREGIPDPGLAFRWGFQWTFYD